MGAWVFFRSEARRRLCAPPGPDAIQYGHGIAGEADRAGFTAIQSAETTGRALGTADFGTDLEQRLGRPITRRAPGRKPAARGEAQPGLL
jgi:hypothetical protein